MKLRTPVRCVFGAPGDLRFEFEFLTHGRQGAPALMKEFPPGVVAKANHLCATDQTAWLTTKTQSAFLEFVRRGGGLCLIKAGTCCQDLPEMRGVTGGTFLSHPVPCLVTMEPKAGHTLTKGVEQFTLRDEHYIMALDAGRSARRLDANRRQRPRVRVDAGTQCRSLVARRIPEAAAEWAELAGEVVLMKLEKKCVLTRPLPRGEGESFAASPENLRLYLPDSHPKIWKRAIAVLSPRGRGSG